jgi:Concanavalin A-like lectin/glucanases superfamily
MKRRIRPRPAYALSVAAAGSVLAVCAAPAAARDLWVAPTGSDANPCSPAAPCSSMDRAYRVAAPGDTIRVAAGTYGAQNVPALGKATAGSRITIEASGAVQINGGVAVADSYVTIRGSFNATGTWGFENGSTPISGVTLSQVRGRMVWANNVRDFTVTDSDFGPNPGDKVFVIGAFPESYNVTLDRVRLHDNPPTEAPQHLECLFANHVQGLTVRNSVFERCGYFNIAVSECCGGTLPPRDLVLENNVFGQTYRWDNGAKLTAPCALIMGANRWGGQNVFRNNYYTTPPCYSGTTFATPAKASGNVGPTGMCHSGIVYRYNVFSDRTCGDGDRRVPNILSTFDGSWKLQAGSPAINSGDPANAPARDREGQERDTAPDAGPDEYGSPGVLGLVLPTPFTERGSGTRRAARGLVGAWSFDEPDGALALDSSAFGNAGTLSGPRRARGRFGGALLLDGNDVVNVAHSPSLDLRRALTIEAWVRPSARGREWRTIALKQKGRHLAYGLYASAGGRPSAHVFRRREYGLRARRALKRKRWAHLATTWDGKVLRLWLNGRQVRATRVRGPLTASTGMLRFGGNRIWREWFRGKLDEIRIYNRALSRRQIAKDRVKPIGVGAAATSSVPADSWGRPLRRRHSTRWG